MTAEEPESFLDRWHQRQSSAADAFKGVSNWCLSNKWTALQAILLIYYPLLYFEKASRKIYISGRDGASPVQNHAAVALIVGALLYMLLVSCKLLSSNEKLPKEQQAPSTQEQAPADSEDIEREKGLMSTNIETGLSQEEARLRLKTFGPNEIWPGRDWIAFFREHLLVPASLMIETSALVAFIFHDWLDLVPICTLLALQLRDAVNPTRDADEVIDSLSWNSSQSVVVLRDGKISEVKARYLVPGDIVHVSDGSTIPADGRVVAFDGILHVDQSSITGESDPIHKEYEQMCYASTGVVRGDAFLLITDTGIRTFVGRTAALVNHELSADKSSTETPRHVDGFDSVLQNLGVLILSLIFGTVILCGLFDRSQTLWLNMLHLAANLSIISILFRPSSSVTSYRAIGASQLSEIGAVVRDASIGTESLAGIDVLCVEKTGTITENRPTLSEPYCVSCEAEDLLLTASLSTPPDMRQFDPVDRAFVKSLKQYPRAKAQLDRYRILDFQPFDPEMGRMQCLVESPLGESVLCTKGSPRAILELYLQDNPDEIAVKESYIEAARGFARSGISALGIARKRENQKWELLGLAPLFDPSRFDTKLAVQLARELSIAVKMCTGDAETAARTIVPSIGLGSQFFDMDSIAEGDDDEKAATSPDLAAQIELADVYVNTTDKEQIVTALQSRGHWVAATGDGLADTAVLQRADCGIAVSDASERAQQASDIVFVDRPGLMSMLKAVQVSRQVFQQIYNHVSTRTLTLLHVMLVVLGYFAIYGESFNLQLFIFGTQLTELVHAVCRHATCADIPFSRTPVRWSTKRLLREVVPLVLVSALGSFFAAALTQARNTGAADDVPTLSAPQAMLRMLTKHSQACSLHILLVSHWTTLLMHTSGAFTDFFRDPKEVCGLLCLDGLASIACISGWVSNEPSLSVADVSWVWGAGLVTFFAAVAVRFLTFQGQLQKGILPEKNIGD